MRIAILILIMFSICFSRVKTDTIYIVGLVSGYVPYQSSAGKLVISPIFTNGFNAAVGKATVEMWAGTQRAFQIGGSSAWMGIAAESGSSDFYGLNNLYFDGAWKPYVNGTSARFHFGTSGFLYAYDTGVVADVGFTPTNRFSWTLAGGLNVASKGTFTSLAAGDTLTAKKARFDSLQFDGGSYLKTYVEGSFPCTLKTTQVTVQQIGTAYYTKIGKTVTISFPVLEGTSNSTVLLMHCQLPYNPRQTYGGYYNLGESVPVVDNGATKSGYVNFNSINPTYLSFNLFGSTFTSSGLKGTYAFTLRYVTD